MKVILLAAGVGRRFGPEAKTLPKCLIPLGKRGANLLSRAFDSFRALGLDSIVIVVGHQKEKIKKECQRSGKNLNLRFLFNEDYTKGSVLSLYTAREELDEDCLIMDADVYFETPALRKLLHSRHRTAFLIDAGTKSTGEEMMLMAREGRPFLISKRTRPGLEVLGESVGFLKIGRSDALGLRRILEDFVLAGKHHVEYEETYNRLMHLRNVGFEKIHTFWREMDFREDWERILLYLKKHHPFKNLP